MLSSFFTAILLGASLSIAAPLNPRSVTLDPAATAEAQKRDNTATRAFTAVPITTSSGLCFHVDPLSGDFRENLTPIQLLPCNGTANQQWDVITAGVHNNVPGTALIVSSLTNACLNFDPRRATGNQVLLFSCGGRADGGGTVTNSQQFPFVGGNVIPLLPLNGNNATCLTSGSGSLLDQASCNAASPSADELFTIGSSGTAASPPPAIETTTTSAAPTVTPTPSPTSSSPTSSPTATTVAGAGLVLNPSAVAEANPRDNTATRAFSAAAIKTSTGQCLDIDPLSGDFRENLIPIQIKDCDGSPNQQWDVITAGVHNNVPGTALIVSTLTNGCMNFDPRRAAGNQVLLFSCGGRADGGGSVTNSQQFTFTGIPSGAIPLTPLNGNNAVCLTSSGSLLDQSSCNPSQPSASELFTITGGSGAVDSASPTSAPASTTASAVVNIVTNPPTTTTASTTLNTATVTSVSRAGVVLNPSAAAEANPRDNTAVRAFTAAQVKTSSGSCLHIDPTAGDFRENLIPIQIKACDGSPNQQFDVITSGVHNNVPGAALIVSTLTNGCLNFDPRRAVGDQTILFSCGGRADGGGAVTNSQLFNFNATQATNVALIPQNGISGTSAVCLTASGSTLDNESCVLGSASGDELFSFVQ